MGGNTLMPTGYYSYLTTYFDGSVPLSPEPIVNRVSTIPFKVGDIVYDASVNPNDPQVTKIKILAVQIDTFDYELINYSIKNYIGRQGNLRYIKGSWKLWQKTGLAKFIELQAALSGDCQGQENLTI